jgi:hypothetical protein
LGHEIIALEESADFATLDTEKLFSKLKSHELSSKGGPNHNAYLTSKTFVTSARVGDHVAKPTNTTDSSTLEFGLSSLAAASDEQYESIPDDEIALLARKFHALHRFRRDRRRSLRGCFECDDTTHFHRRLPQAEEAWQARGPEEVPLQGQEEEEEEELLEDDVPSMCCAQRPRLFQR